MFAFFFGADTNRLFDRRYKNFAITDFSGFGRLHNRCHGGVNPRVGKDQFDFDLREEIDRVFAAAVDFGMAFLAAEPLDFADGHAFDSNVAEGILYFLQLEWLYDRFNFFHSFDERDSGLGPLAASVPEVVIMHGRLP